MNKASTDIWFCAFLMLNNIKISSYEVIGRGKVRCHFQVTDEDWHKYKLDFNNSDHVKYKSFIEQIKDLGF